MVEHFVSTISLKRVCILKVTKSVLMLCELFLVLLYVGTFRYASMLFLIDHFAYLLILLLHSYA